MKKVLLAVVLAVSASSVMAEKHLLQGSVYLNNPGAQSKAQFQADYNQVYEDLFSCNRAIGQIAAARPSMLSSIEAKYGTFEKVVFLSCTPVWQPVE